MHKYFVDGKSKKKIAGLQLDFPPPVALNICLKSAIKQFPPEKLDKGVSRMNIDYRYFLYSYDIE